MRSLAAVALSVVLSVPALGQDTQICDNPPIPERYRHVPEYPVPIRRVSMGELPDYCGPSALACTRADRVEIVIPNFETLRELGLSLADSWCLLQHEYAHANGWPADHPP